MAENAGCESGMPRGGARGGRRQPGRDCLGAAVCRWREWQAARVLQALWALAVGRVQCPTRVEEGQRGDPPAVGPPSPVGQQRRAGGDAIRPIRPRRAPIGRPRPWRKRGRLAREQALDAAGTTFAGPCKSGIWPPADLARGRRRLALAVPSTRVSSLCERNISSLPLRPSSSSLLANALGWLLLSAVVPPPFPLPLSFFSPPRRPRHHRRSSPRVCMLITCYACPPSHPSR